MLRLNTFSTHKNRHGAHNDVDLTPFTTSSDVAYFEYSADSVRCATWRPWEV